MQTLRDNKLCITPLANKKSHEKNFCRTSYANEYRSLQQHSFAPPHSQALFLGMMFCPQKEPNRGNRFAPPHEDMHCIQGSNEERRLRHTPPNGTGSIEGKNSWRGRTCGVIAGWNRTGGKARPSRWNERATGWARRLTAPECLCWSTLEAGRNQHIILHSGSPRLAECPGLGPNPRKTQISYVAGKRQPRSARPNSVCQAAKDGFHWPGW